MFSRLFVFLFVVSLSVVLIECAVKEDPVLSAPLVNGTKSTQNYYELLGLKRDCPSRAVTNAYRKLARSAHPDKFNDPAEKAIANENFMRIAFAYDVLKNDNKRKLYDSMVDKGMFDFDEEEYFRIFERREDGERSAWNNWGDVTIYDIPYVASMSDDTVLIICGLGTLIMIGIPIYQHITGSPKKKTKQDVKKEMLASISTKKKVEDKRRAEELRLSAVIAELSDDDDDEDTLSPSSKKGGFAHKSDSIADQAAQRQRELKKQEQAKKKRLRAILKTICKPYISGGRDEAGAGSPKNSSARIFSGDDLDLLVHSAAVNDLENLNNSLVRALGRKEYSDDDVSATADQVQAAFRIFSAEVAKVQSQQASAAKVSAKSNDKKSSKTASVDSGAAWSHSELSILSKAMAKFPGGIAQRWEKITELVNTVGKRTEKEVIKKAREAENVALKKTDADAFEVYQENMKKGKEDSSSAADLSEGVWSAEQQSALENALKELKNNSSAVEDRWSVIAAAVPGKTRNQCMLRYKSIREQLGNKQ